MPGCVTHKEMCFTRVNVDSRTNLGGWTDH